VPALMGIDLATASARDPLQGITPLGVVLDEQPATTVARGLAQQVDLLIGHNTEEGNIYLLPSGAMDATTLADVRTAAEYTHPDPDRLLSVYEPLHPEATHGELRSIILGEAVFGVGSRALADAHAATGRGRTFVYAFTWRSPALGGRLGATHIVEVPFAFDTTLLPELQGEGRLLGQAPAPQAIAKSMHSAWIEFIATGSPGWSPYDLEQRATMLIGEEPSVAADPFATQRAAWN
jgi:para-nitrobenzyl esterase